MSVEIPKIEGLSKERGSGGTSYVIEVVWHRDTPNETRQFYMNEATGDPEQIRKLALDRLRYQGGPNEPRSIIVHRVTLEPMMRITMETKEEAA